MPGLRRRRRRPFPVLPELVAGRDASYTPIMLRDPSSLLDEALRLPAEARAHLAAELLRSLDQEEEPLDEAEYDRAWGDVIERRLREIETGAATPVPWSDARRRIAGEG